MSLGRVVDILERHGIGGQEMRDLADEVNGERDPETGLRGGNADASPDDSESDEPAQSATRAEWDAYAESRGVDPSDYENKDALIDAVRAHKS